MDKNTYSVYKHTSPSGKVYIGQTKHSTASRRWLYPKFAYKSCAKLLAAINKYGWDSFTTEILASRLSINQANVLEQYYIKLHDSTLTGYNLQSGGKNYIHSAETKAKIGKANLGRVFDATTRLKMSESRKKIMTAEYRKMLSEKSSGWKHTQEAKNKIGKQSKGNHYVLGRKQSPEERFRRSEIAKKRQPLDCGHKRHNRYTTC